MFIIYGEKFKIFKNRPDSSLVDPSEQDNIVEEIYQEKETLLADTKRWYGFAIPELIMALEWYEMDIIIFRYLCCSPLKEKNFVLGILCDSIEVGQLSSMIISINGEKPLEWATFDKSLIRYNTTLLSIY